MTFPLDFWDVSLLLAITAIILLITAELLSQYYGKINILINRKKLKSISILFSILFLGTVVIRIISIIMSP
jgi:hypothetical protein